MVKIHKTERETDWLFPFLFLFSVKRLQFYRMIFYTAMDEMHKNQIIVCLTCEWKTTMKICKIEPSKNTGNPRRIRKWRKRIS